MFLSLQIKPQPDLNTTPPPVIPDKYEETVFSNSNDKKEYLVDDDNHIQFFKNPKFGPYLIEYLQQKEPAVQIEIQQSPSTNNQLESSFTCTLFLSGPTRGVQSTYDDIKKLFQTMKIKIYKSIRGKHLTLCFTDILTCRRGWVRVSRSDFLY
jgi:hypothetical protein